MPLTPEHAAARLNGVGGSDLPAILHEFLADAGDTVYGCPRALWLEKRRVPADYEFEVTGAIKRGEILEPIIAQIYSEETGRKVRRIQHQIGKEKPWEMVSIDRQIVGDEQGVGILECKCVGREIWYQILKGGLPLRYLIQVLWGFHVLGHQYEWGDDAVLWPDGWQYHFYRVERDQHLIDMMAKMVADFWQRVQNNDPPPRLRWTDKRCQRCRWRTSCQGDDLLEEAAKDITTFEEVSTSEDLAPKVALRMELKEIMDDAKVSKDEVENEIKDAMVTAGRQIVIAGGHKITFIQQEGGFTVDNKRLQIEEPETYDRYKKPRKGARPLKFYPI